MLILLLLFPLFSFRFRSRHSLCSTLLLLFSFKISIKMIFPVTFSCLNGDNTRTRTGTSAAHARTHVSAVILKAACFRTDTPTLRVHEAIFCALNHYKWFVQDTNVQRTPPPTSSSCFSSFSLVFHPVFLVSDFFVRRFQRLDLM